MLRLLAALCILCVCVPVALADERAEVRGWAGIWRAVDRDLGEDAPGIYRQVRAEMTTCASGAPSVERIRLARWITIDRTLALHERDLARRAVQLQRLDLQSAPLRALRAASVEELRAWAADARDFAPVDACAVLGAVDRAAQLIPAYPLRAQEPILLTEDFLHALGYVQAEVTCWVEVEGCRPPRRTLATAGVQAQVASAERVLAGRGWERSVARTLHAFDRDPITDF